MAKLKIADIGNLTFGQKFYRVAHHADRIESLVYCGLHPYAKGTKGWIVQQTCDVNKLFYIYSGANETTYSYFDNYDEASEKLIEEAKSNLESIIEIYGKKDL